MHDRDSSPDYASTTHSKEEEQQQQQRPAPRKFGGVRKTVGDPNYATQDKNNHVPYFDFGVTQSLTPLPSRPGTAAGRVSPLETTTTPPITPQTPSSNRKYGDRPSPAYISPLPSPISQRPASQIWYPGLAAGRQSPAGGLTAEEFVQHRVNLARLPGGYAQRRTVSANRIEEMVLPVEQPPQRKLHRMSSSRPGSRGSTLDFSGTLSAREQEHVARMTGSPLLSLQERSQTPDPSVGLIGAISAREQDRRNMREGISGQLVQAAISQRQQQAQAAYMQQVQAHHRSLSSTWSQPQVSYANPAYYPTHHYSQSQQQLYSPAQQQSYAPVQYQQGGQIYREYAGLYNGYQRQ